MTNWPQGSRRLLRGCPRWARFLVECGSELATIDSSAPVTLILTLPRRELASGFVAYGYVQTMECQEWASALLNPSFEFTPGTYAYFVDQKGRIRKGVVEAGSPLGVVVSGPEPFTKRTFEGHVMLSVVSHDQCFQPPGRKVRGLAALSELLDSRVRARSFVLRNSCRVLAVGSETTTLEEWANCNIAEDAESVSLACLIQGSTHQDRDFSRAACVSDRKSPQLGGKDAAETLLILDGYRSWLNWMGKPGHRKRVVLADRTSDDFPYFLDALMRNREGPFKPLELLNSVPAGIEAFAYNHVVIQDGF